MYLTEEQNLIRKTVRDFAEREIKPLARELDEKALFSTELTKRMGEMGFMGIQVPTEYGGQNLDQLSYIIIIEELARIDSSQAAKVMAHNSLGITPILDFGTEEQKQQYLPKLCSGNALWSFGLTEPEAGSDSRNSKTKAINNGDFWTINGSKIFITNGASEISLGTTLQTISADSNDNKIFTTFLIDSNTPGFTRRQMKGKMMWRASDTGELFFNNCVVPDANRLGDIGMGSRIMLQTLDKGRLSISAMALGLAQGAYELARNYAKERKQFGKPIAHFQAISFKLAEMITRIEASRNLLYNTCAIKYEGENFTKQAAITKLFCSETAFFVANEAVQILGGYGLMADYDVERFYRDVRILQIGEGTSEIQKLVISRILLNE